MLYALLTILLCPFLQGDGFARGTLVKTPHGYRTIESLQINDDVICCDIKTGRNYIRPITAIKKSKSTSYFVRFPSSFAIIGHDQLLYIPIFESWVPIQKFLDPDYLSQQTLIRRIIPFKPEMLIALSIAEFHNFYVTEDDILAHNTPAIFVATTTSETIIPAVITFGTMAATYLGISHKSSKKQTPNNNPRTSTYFESLSGFSMRFK